MNMALPHNIRRRFDTFRPPWLRPKSDPHRFDTMRPEDAGAADSTDLPKPETFASRSNNPTNR